MANFNFNISSSLFSVSLENNTETDCSSTYQYKVTSQSGNNISLKVGGVGQYPLNMYYTVLGVDTQFTNNSTISLTYGLDLYISFSIGNSGSPGVFNEVDIQVIDNTTAESYNQFDASVTRLNDNASCEAVGVTATTYDELIDTPEDKIGHSLKIIRVSADETKHEYVDFNVFENEYAVPGSADMLKSVYDAANITEQLVGLVASQTLTNKTLTSPNINEAVALTATSTELNLLEGITTLSGNNTGDQDVSGKQNVLSEGAFVDGDKTKLDGLSATFPLGLAFGGENTDIAVGTDKLTFQMPHFATTLTGVSVNVKTAPTGSVATFDLNEAGTSVLSTKITIDAGKKTSVTASTPPVISESAIPANAIMTVDIDGVGSTVAGVAPKLWIYYTVPKIAPNAPNMLPFKFTVNTALSGTSASNQFTIPVGAGTFLYDVTTDDGYSATGLTGNHTITFPTGAGTHTVEITGSFPAMQFASGGDRNKFSTIERFGIYGINSLNQNAAFYGCSNLLINATDIGHLENVTNFFQFFRSCGSITSIPRFNTSSATSLSLAFYQCGSLAEFPLIDTSNVTNLSQTWVYCNSMTSFPLINTSKVPNFQLTWFRCRSLTEFPAINLINATSFSRAWDNCNSLETFSANIFDNSISTANYSDAFLSTNLTEQSIDNILVSIDANGVSNGTFEQSGGEAPSAIGIAAKDSLVSKGWTIIYTI